ncbi:MAG: response regulator transcription factor [Cytophagaceae bacterium]
MSKKKKILITDDEPSIIELLEYNLRREGYTIKTCDNGKEAIVIAKTFIPDLILLDIMMPELDGIETCRQLRTISSLKNTIIIFLTARSEEYTEVAGFEVGANDFITKPIKPRALMSRISAVLRREETEQKNNNFLKFKDLSIDKESYTVIRNDKKIKLTKKEFELLFFLCQNPNKVFNRDDILKSIWGEDVFVVPRTIDVHIRKIREKVGEDLINTIKGIGYKFEENT